MTTENNWGEVKVTALPHETDPCPFSIGEVGIYEAFSQFFEKRFPNLQVFKGLSNRVSIEKPPFIIIQTILGTRISTQETRYSEDSKFMKEFSKNILRLDFYGSPKNPASNMAVRFKTLWNDDSTFEFFKSLNIPLSPLYVDDLNLGPFVASEDQYSDRFSCDAYFEYHPEVQIPQESATEIIMSVGLADAK